MAFPEIEAVKIKRKFLWWTWENEKRARKGWEDLGERQGIPQGGSITVSFCSVCASRVHVGREGGKTFNFCPLCLQLVQVTKTQ